MKIEIFYASQGQAIRAIREFSFEFFQFSWPPEFFWISKFPQYPPNLS